MKIHTVIVIALFVPALCLGAMEGHPGFVPFDDAGMPAMAKVEVEVNLAGPMLAMITGITSDSDPGFSEFADQLEGIRVRVGEPASRDLEELERDIDGVEQYLDSRGWSRIVRVNEDGERVLVFTRDNGTMIDGLVVVALEGLEELVIVNIVGTIDPAALGKLIGSIEGLGDIDFDIEVGR